MVKCNAYNAIPNVLHVKIASLIASNVWTIRIDDLSPIAIVIIYTLKLMGHVYNKSVRPGSSNRIIIV